MMGHAKITTTQIYADVDEEKIKDDMKKEGQDFKQIFYEEFGAFKNDSTIKKNTLQVPKQENNNKVKSNDDFEFE